MILLSERLLCMRSFKVRPMQSVDEAQDLGFLLSIESPQSNLASKRYSQEEKTFAQYVLCLDLIQIRELINKITNIYMLIIFKYLILYNSNLFTNINIITKEQKKKKKTISSIITTWQSLFKISKLMDKDAYMVLYLAKEKQNYSYNSITFKAWK